MIQGVLLAQSTGEDTQTQLWRHVNGQTMVVVQAVSTTSKRLFKVEPVSKTEAQRLYAIASWQRLVPAEQALL